MAADTAEGLLAEIESTKQQVQAAEVRNQELCVLTREAEKRQRLRRELDVQRTILANRQRLNALESLYRHEVDRDEDGPHCLTAGPRSQAVASKEHPQDASGGERTNCAHKVAKGEYVWQIDSFSWSRLRLRQSGLFCVVSKLFKVGGYEFQFVYQPDGGIVNCTLSQRGSLAIIFWGSDPIVLRYRIFIKARSGEFVQWGELREELHDVDDGPPTAYGPDVHEAENAPASLGIFGLTHQQLLQSAWVDKDTLTAKFVLEVHPVGTFETQPLLTHVEVPGSTLHQDTQALWEKGTGSDVQFMVQGVTLQAHSHILSARSHVFEKQLACGMQESASRVVVIEDSDPDTFKCLLQFLYTDSFKGIEDLMAKTAGKSDAGNPRLSQAQALLAVSHKYEVTRLQRWCEMRLCEHLCTSEVCNILSQAHLLEAAQLEKACLVYIKDHIQEVLKSPAYVELMKVWPQIGLKVSLFAAGVPEAEAAEAINGFKGSATAGKRKRTEEE